MVGVQSRYKREREPYSFRNENEVEVTAGKDG
jgi:hypothetical protein